MHKRFLVGGSIVSAQIAHSNLQMLIENRIKKTETKQIVVY